MSDMDTSPCPCFLDDTYNSQTRLSKNVVTQLNYPEDCIKRNTTVNKFYQCLILMNCENSVVSSFLCIGIWKSGDDTTQAR